VGTHKDYHVEGLRDGTLRTDLTARSRSINAPLRIDLDLWAFLVPWTVLGGFVHVDGDSQMGLQQNGFDTNSY